MKIKGLTIFLLCILSAGLWAQSTANEIETLLETSAVTYAQAARFVLEAADQMFTSDPQEAFRFAEEQKWLPKRANYDEEARLDGLSLLFMRSFDIKGGIFYSLTKSPHHSYREMTYNNFIVGRSDPAMKVSGDMLLFITSRILSYYENRENLDADREERRQAAEVRRREAEERRREAAAARQEALIARISSMIERQNVADTTVGATREGITITLSNIQFPPDSAVLQETERTKLREISNVLNDIPNLRLLIAGHTALAGSEEGQHRISSERAQSVAAYLIMLEVCEEENITVIGHGSDLPIADNSTQRGMALNRRVEITILED